MIWIFLELVHAFSFVGAREVSSSSSLDHLLSPTLIRVPSSLGDPLKVFVCFAPGRECHLISSFFLLFFIICVNVIISAIIIFIILIIVIIIINVITSLIILVILIIVIAMTSTRMHQHATE